MLSNISKYSAILSIIPAIMNYISPGKIAVITMLCSYFLIAATLFYFLEISSTINFKGVKIIHLFILLNLSIIFTGILSLKTSEDSKVLISSTIPSLLFLPFSIYFGAFLNPLKSFFRYFLKYGILLSLILLFTKTNLGIYGFNKMISPIYLLIIFSPYLPRKIKFLIYSLGIISFFSALDTRSNMINLFIAFFISITYYIRKIDISINLIKFLRLFLIIAPIVFLVLGVSGKFNIFKIGDYTGAIVMSDSKGGDNDIVVDSRTSIYTDVFSQLQKDKAIIWGLGGSGKTATSLTDIEYADFDEVYKEGRRGTESGMLNYIQYSGIIGLIIYLMLFTIASKLAIYNSKNWLCIMIGLWVAFRSLYSFIEDRLIFSIYSLSILVSVGMCFNTALRNMSEIQVKVFLRSFFEKKYNQFLVLKEI